jgi:zinc and cadmium transporter
MISFIGILTLLLKESILRKILLFFVSFAAGALLGDAFIHLLPEAVKNGFTIYVSMYLLLGILAFFILEKFIFWRHCHIETSEQHPHPVGMMNLVGDGMHNLTDGMIIAGSYYVSIPVGLATTLAVIFHEIPQEIGDFSVLLHAGYTKLKALFYNFLSALTAVIGAIITLIAGANSHNFSVFIIPFTAGGFIYIASSDLIPELHKETAIWKSFFQLVGIILGILVMFVLLFLE